MTTIWKGSTNGGANRFFVKDEKVMVAGQGVGGRQEVNLDILEDVWGFDTKATGNITGDIQAFQINVFVNDAGNAIVSLGGGGIGGGFKFEFEDKFYKDVNVKKINDKLSDSNIRTDGSVDSKAEGAAINFALFLEEMLEFDTLGFISAHGADTSKITDLDGALSQLDFNDIRDSDNTVKFGGLGVSGSTRTDSFGSESAAENFIETVKSDVFGNGFLDEILT